MRLSFPARSYVATTLTEPTTTNVESLSFSFPISKSERDADGDLVVYGVATDGTVDSDRQIVDPEWSGKALADWLSTGGNVRMSHDPQRPVGKGLSVEIDRDGNGQHWVKSVVVDPTAARLVEKGILRAYSVGISQPVIKRDPTGRAPGGIICGGELSELSIVDRPANKNSYLELATKAAGSNAATFTGIFHEGVSDDIVKKAAGTFSPADLAKLLEHRRAAEKRKMDPDVGGGVDRDKIPASDFAGRDRSFPIVTPGDVSDAASSIDRAGPSNYSSDKLKRNIIRIARRKGPSFVAELPDAWTNKKGKGSKKANKYAMQSNPPQSPPTPGAMPPASAPHPAAPVGHAPAPAATPPGQMPQHGAPAPGPAHPAPGSGQGDMGQPQPHQPQPGAEPQMIKDHMAATGHQVQPGMHFCPDCGSPVAGGEEMGAPTNNGPNVDSSGTMHVEMPMHAGAQHDEMPATKADVPSGASTSVSEPQESKPVDAVTQAKKKPKKQPKPKSLDPATGVYEKKPKKNQPVPTPKEAPSVDGLPSTSTKSADFAMETAMLLKGMNVPADLGALHDLLCPGFHPDDAEKCHPGHSLKSMDVSYWQTEALQSAASAPLDEAVAAQSRWQAAEAIKSRATNNPTEVMEIRHEAHKAFKDAQIGPGTAPVPTQIRAGQFKRPLITAGHGRPSSGQESPNTAEVPSDGIAASQFTGGYLSSGHAAASPSNNKANDSIAYPKATGQVQAIDYSGASRDAAKSAMNAIHDHISHTFPDLCPMGSPGTGDLGHVPSGDTKVPQPVGAPASKSKSKSKKAKVNKSAAAGPDLTVLLQSMKDEFSAELATLTKSLKTAEKRNKKLQSTVDQMAAMPDPNVAAFKGVALTHPINKGASPTARTVAETAEQTQLMMMRELENQWRSNPDPAQREAAWASLSKMRGL